MRRWSIALVVISLALPAAASAETRYVQNGGLDGTDCTNPGAKCATIEWAITQAGDGDTIDIGPGVYNESVQTAKVLTFIGKGSGSIGGAPATTLIRGPVGNNAAGAPGMLLQNGGTVRSLRVEGGDGDSSIAFNGEPGGHGIVYPSISAAPTALLLENVVTRGGDGGPGASIPGTGGNGVESEAGPGPIALTAIQSEFGGGSGFGAGGALWIDGPAASATIRASRMPDSATGGDGLVAFKGARVVLETTDITVDGLATTIYEGSLTVIRSRLTSEGTPFYVDGSGDESPEAQIVDSLVVSEKTEAVYVNTEEQGSAAVTIRGSTLIGHGLSAVNAVRQEGAGPTSLTLVNSIARQFLPPGFPIPPADLAVDGATISAASSSYANVREANGGTVTPPGSAGNVAVDPGFVDPVAGSYALAGTSPLIDRGDPTAVTPGELDLVGTARSLDGNFDCVSAPDIGAYEVIGPVPACLGDLPPVVSKFGMTNKVFAPKGKRRRHHKARASAKRKAKVKRGTKFTYTLSEAARIVITIERRVKKRKRRPRFVKSTSLRAQKKAGKQSTAFSGRVKGRALKPGRYRATIVATDPAGQASKPLRASFRIVDG